MSFDLLVSTCNLGRETVETVNPFTGEVVRTHAGEHAKEAEVFAVERLLASFKAGSTGDEGGYTINTVDGALIELHLDEGYGKGGIGLRDLTPTVCEFLLQLARVGNYALTPIMDDPSTIVTSPERAERIQSRWPNSIVCTSAEQIESSLADAVDRWKKLTNRTIGE